jgi:SlyX protein
MSAGDDLEQRLTELEVRLTFIDDAVAALTAADAEQAMRIQSLEHLVSQLRSELSAVRTAQGHDPHSEPPPPHY